jgi:hypothetical protein
VPFQGASRIGSGAGNLVVAPRARARQTDRQDSREKRLAAERMLPMLANEPTERIEAAEPIEPMESADPTDPIDSTEPTESIDSTDPRDRIDRTDRLEDEGRDRSAMRPT